MLSHSEAKAFYDRFGSKQDRQAWYERPALDRLVAHSRFDKAKSVLELGCGTGRFAGRILELLPAEATYLGLDSSDTMLRLSEERLGRFGDRVRLRKTDGSVGVPESSEVQDEGRRFDRMVSNYVLDLLPEREIESWIAEASHVLVEGGLLGLTTLSYGDRGLARWVPRLWSLVHRLRPQIVGGCRPIRLLPFVQRTQWAVLHHSRVTVRGLVSEVLVAERASPPNATVRGSRG